MTKVNLKDLVWEQEVYPRANLSGKTVDDYIEALKSGAKFPPLKAQKIGREIDDNHKEKIIILDGVHRFEAYKGFNQWLSDGKKKEEEDKDKLKFEENHLEKIEQVEVDFWREDILDYEKYLTDLFLEAVLPNIRHGNRLKMEDKKNGIERLARIYAEQQKNGKESLHGIFALSRENFKRFMEKDFAVGWRSVYRWTQSIFQDVINERDNLIYSLSQLGWIQEDIATAVIEAGFEKEYARNSVGMRLSIFAHIQELTKLQYDKMNKSVEDIAKENKKSKQLVWSILLEGKEDKDRIEEINSSLSKDEEEIALKIYDNWSYSGCNKLMGIKYDGQIPGQIVLNVLHYYTKPGDLILDPMAGGGVTNDACLLFGRKCYSYDVDPSKSGRKDIIKFKTSPENGLPERINKANLVFIDPPYWSMKDKEYPEGSWSELSYDDFCQKVEWFASELYNKMKSGAYIAWIIQNQTEKDLGDKAYIDWSFFSYKKFLEAGFEPIRRISCPQSTDPFLPQQVEKAKKEKRMLGIVRDLLIFKKTEDK